MCEVIETILPDNEVVLSVRIFDECARNAIVIAEFLELCAVVDKPVSTSAYHPEEFVLFLHLLYIWDELSCTLVFGAEEKPPT